MFFNQNCSILSNFTVFTFWAIGKIPQLKISCYSQKKLRKKRRKKCYPLSFPILGGRDSTRALQSIPFQNPGGGSRLLTNQGPDRSGGCLILIRQQPDQSGCRLILIWHVPDRSGSCLILIRQQPD